MPTILIIDDEYDIRFLYQEELVSNGYDVITASSGEEALQIISEKTPDLITLDLKMPSMSGVDFLDQLKRMKPDIPVLVVTAFNHSHYEKQTLACEGYIVKSSDLTQLRQKIGKLLKAKNKAKRSSNLGNS